MEKEKVCPKCNGKMEIGNYLGNEFDWHQDSNHMFLKHRGKKVISYACRECGYIENYVIRH